MKKIVLYIDTLNRGGAERVLCNLANYFSRKQYDVTLIKDYRQDHRGISYELDDRVKLVCLGETYDTNPIRRNIYRIKSLRKIIKKDAPDTVLSFLGVPNMIMLTATVGMRVKKYVSVRSDPNREYGTNRLKKLLVNALFLTADGVVFQTENAKKYFHSKIQKKARVILNPVSKEFYSVIKDPDAAQIVACGRIIKEKNYPLLIRAFAKIADAVDHDLYIYGDGPLMDESVQFSKKIGVGDRVHFMGAVDRVHEVLRSAELFVMSSDVEGLPNALMEAMAAGCACISTDCPCGGQKMLFADNAGVLVPCNDVEQLSNAMLDVLRDDQKRERLEASARKRSLDFLPETVYSEWESYLT